MCGSNVRWKTVPESTASSGESTIAGNAIGCCWAELRLTRFRTFSRINAASVASDAGFNGHLLNGRRSKRPHYALYIGLQSVCLFICLSVRPVPASNSRMKTSRKPKIVEKVASTSRVTYLRTSLKEKAKFSGQTRKAT